MNCAICEKRIEPGQRVVVEVVGFEKRRSQGGTNALMLRQQTGREAHEVCVTASRHGWQPGQAAIV